jgi:GT2 family glycosyltransferase
MFDREKLIEIGMFDPLLRPIYWEDVEIGYRAWKRGLSVVYEPRSIVRHRVSSTMRTVNQSKLRRLQQRNRLLFVWINLHDRGLMMSHVAWVILLAITALPRLKPGYLHSLFAALGRLPRVSRRRREEKRAARRSDREVFAIFEALSSRQDIFSYDDDSELERARRALAGPSSA